MHKTIRNYTIDYNKNKKQSFKNIEDLICLYSKLTQTIGWKKSTLGTKIELKDNIKKNILILRQEISKIKKK